MPFVESPASRFLDGIRAEARQPPRFEQPPAPACRRFYAYGGALGYWARNIANVGVATAPEYCRDAEAPICK